MENENSQNVFQKVENHIHLPLSENKISEQKKTSKKGYKWLLTLVLVPLMVAVISRPDFIFKNDKCDYLEKQLANKTKELDDIRNILKRGNEVGYLKLYSDSISHVIQINQINEELIKEKCKN